MIIANAIPITTVKLSWQKPLQGPPKPHLLRGAIAGSFPKESLLHQHNNDGLIYRYPLVQYRWQRNEGILAGFHEGAKLLANLSFLDLSLKLGIEEVTIADVELNCGLGAVSVSDRLIRYRFVSPWLPFNQDTYESYSKMDILAKAYERDRLATANILMMLKGLKVEFPVRLYAVVEARKTIVCQYKDQKLTGILGTLVTNADLPSGVAIGKAVSHGFGWIERI